MFVANLYSRQLIIATLSYRDVPRLHMSDCKSYGTPSRISGATYLRHRARKCN
jgi:hypothetical protein